MSEPPRSPFQARPRLPTEGAPAPGASPGGQGAARGLILLIYATAFFSMAGAALFMALARNAAPLSPQVLIPGVGALWFLVRIVMIMRPKPPQGT